MIYAAEDLSVVQQCQLVGVPRSSVYYRRQPVTDRDLAVWAGSMRSIWPTRSWGAGGSPTWCVISAGG